MKKIICCILVLTLIILTFPMKMSVAFSSEQAFFDYLASENIQTYNNENKMVNFETYKTYSLVVYGSPWGDSKKSETIQGRMEQRYLGYTVKNEPYSNPLFPPDSNTGAPYESFNYIYVSGAEKSWGSLEPEQKTYMQNALLIGDRVTTQTFTINSIGGVKYAKVLSASTWKSEGSAHFNHEASNGKIWYVTMKTAPMVGNDLVTGTITTPSNTYYIRTGEDKVNIPVTVTANALLTGQAKVGHIAELNVYYLACESRFIS